MTVPQEVAAVVQRLTPSELAQLIGGRVESVRAPLTISCPTCGRPSGERCRRQGSASPGSGKMYSGAYDGAETEPHPARKLATSGSRVVGPFVPDEVSS